jgi:hypothetical protein
MDDTEAKKVLVQKKHSQHEEILAKIIRDLEYNLEHYSTYSGPESLFAHLKTNTEAILFLCQERKRDRDKRKGDYLKATTELPPSGKDMA